MSDSKRLLRVVIVDDEAPARSLLKHLVSNEVGLEIVSECSSGTEAVNSLRTTKADLVLLDIQMPDLNGFDVIRQVGESRMPFVIFVTAYHEFAVKAFEVHALDYILKPPVPARFTEAIARARTAVHAKRTNGQRPRLTQLLRDIEFDTAGESSSVPIKADRGWLTTIVTRRGSEFRTIPVMTVDWFEAADHFAHAYSKGIRLLIEKPLVQLQSQLDPLKFMRIRRNVIVNLDSIQSVRSARFGAFQVTMPDGRKITTSRFLSSEFRKRLILKVN